MNKEIIKKGGAIIGFLQAKTPLATLSVKQNYLFINSSSLGEYQFTPAEVISLQKTRFLYSSGIKINHNNNDYPKRIIFFCNESNSDVLLENIRNIGFKPIGTETANKKLAFRLNTPNMLFIALILSIFFWILIFHI